MVSQIWGRVGTVYETELLWHAAQFCVSWSLCNSCSLIPPTSWLRWGGGGYSRNKEWLMPLYHSSVLGYHFHPTSILRYHWPYLSSGIPFDHASVMEHCLSYGTPYSPYLYSEIPFDPTSVLGYHLTMPQLWNTIFTLPQFWDTIDPTSVLGSIWPCLSYGARMPPYLNSEIPLYHISDLRHHFNYTSVLRNIVHLVPWHTTPTHLSGSKWDQWSNPRPCTTSHLYSLTRQ
jgi:hypothetical protein